MPKAYLGSFGGGGAGGFFESSFPGFPSFFFPFFEKKQGIVMMSSFQLRIFLTSLLLFGPGPPSCAGGEISRSASPESALSSQATVRPLATSKENRALSFARTTPTAEHDF